MKVRELIGDGGTDNLTKEINEEECERIKLVIKEKMRHIRAAKRTVAELEKALEDYLDYDVIDTQVGEY